MTKRLISLTLAEAILYNRALIGPRPEQPCK